jgi:transposase
VSVALCNSVALRQAGSSHKDIAPVFRITHGSVSNILKRHLETCLTTPRPRSDRPQKTTARHDRYLLRMCRNSRIKPSSQLRADWIRFIKVPVTTRLVNYRLLNDGYLARRPYC